MWFEQVSFSEEHKKLPAGTYTVRFFDDDLYGDLRRVWLLVTLFDIHLYAQLLDDVLTLFDCIFSVLYRIMQSITRDKFRKNL